MSIINPSDPVGSVLDLKLRLDDKRAGWRDNFIENREFKRGEQWTPAQKARMRDANAEPLRINDFWAAIRDKKGTILRGKPIITAFPRENDDIEVAKFFESVIAYILYNQNFDMLEDMVTDDMLVGGLGFIECLWNPLMEDRQGDVELNYLDPLTAYPDIESVLPDYSDGEFFMKALSFPTDQVRRMFPKHKNDIMPRGEEEWRQSGIVRETDDYVQNFESSDEKNIRSDRTEVIETWVKEYGTWAMFQWLGEDTDELKSREVVWHEVENNKDLKELVAKDKEYSLIEVVDHRIKIYTVAGGVLVQGVYSEYAHNRFPFVPYIGIPTETGYPTSQGEQIKESQKIKNMLYSLLIARLTTVNNPPTVVNKYLMDKDDLRKLEQDGMKTGVIIKTKGPIGDALQRQQGVPIDPSIQLVMQMMDQKDERLFGIRGSQRGEREPGVKSGRFFQMLLNQAITAQSSDQLYIGIARRNLGQIIVSYVQQFFTPERSVRIVGEETAGRVIRKGVVPSDLKVGKVDIVTGDATSQPANNLEEFISLVELEEILQRSGDSMGAETLVEAAPIGNKETILRRIKENRQARQQALMGQGGQGPAFPSATGGGGGGS